VTLCPGSGAPAPPCLASNHNVFLQELMIRKSAVCAGNPFTAAGVGFAMTAACVAVGVAAVELVDLVVELVDDVTRGFPPATTCPFTQEY